MAILALARIRLNAVAKDKNDAIRQAGELLVAGGCVSRGYVEGMVARETTMSTYLGAGVAIPHGEYDNRADIYRTGLSVVQFPKGVEWEEGELAHLVIGIAAAGDEHVGVLSQLANVIEDEQVLAQMIHATDPHVILNALKPDVVDPA